QALEDRLKESSAPESSAPREEICDAVLRDLYAETLARGDMKLFLKVVNADLRERHLQLQRERAKESFRTKMKAGMQDLAEAFRAYPAAMALFHQACAIVDNDGRPPKSKNASETP